MDIKANQSTQANTLSVGCHKNEEVHVSEAPKSKEVKSVDVNDISRVTRFYDFDPPNSCGHKWTSGVTKPSDITAEHRRMYINMVDDLKKEEKEVGLKDYVNRRWG